MRSSTKERDLEIHIEKSLTGTYIEELKEQGITEAFLNTSNSDNFYLGFPNDFNKTYALDEKRFWHFLESTQKEELEKLKRDPQYKLKIIQRLDKMIKKYGILKLLKKGLDVDNANFTLLYASPLASSSKQIKEQFRTNEFSITRQVRYSQSNTLLEIDMVIFINGLPIITIELKNPQTGQTARVHGQKQYKEDRDPKEPLLNFARCIVHFTVDTDEIYMTTKLAGKKTFFLPFNKGNNHGKGNPINEFGHKTAYLWEDVLRKESLSELIQNFVKLSGKKEKDPLSKKTLFFPRYHQRDVVKKIIKDATEKGVGQTYLIQHSAGSGKSYSITWVAYQLIETYPLTKKVKGAKSIEDPLFDSVIVVTDRRLLDKQIRDDIKSFSEVKNILAPANSAKELKESLENGKKIIITTIQKFPFIVEGMSDLSNKNFAVIIDEAHSSQSGFAHDKMNEAMGSQESDLDAQDAIIQAMKSRKMKGNASYLAFTATPKAITLEKFGVKQPDGTFKPFHLYSMKQAIEEGFILDVLSNYTTYKSYYEIQKSIENNPLFDTSKAQKKLKAYVEQHKQTIKTKSDIILEHFISKTIKTKKLKNKAKGMVVAQSIESAINYYHALKELLKKQNNPFKIIIAFSGKKTIKGIDYTESELNNFSTKEISEKFDSDEYRLLIVANKFLTGFDQPKLTSMYIDKKLQGVLAVQALSRLNRSANELGKKTEDLFILDFFNTTDEIKKSFDPFYTSTSLSEATDINILHELKDSLDDVGVYENNEIDTFIELYFSGAEYHELSPFIDTSAERFNHTIEWENNEQDKADYKIKAKQFVKIYGQMASIIPYEMESWEKLFWFLKFLIPKLIIQDKNKDTIDDLLDSVDLSTYGLERIKLNTTIHLDDNESELDPQNPNPRGVHGDSDKDFLEEIIKEFNEKWFQGWDATPEEQKIKFITTAEKIEQHPDYKEKYLDNKDTQNRDLAYQRIFDEVMNQQRRNELDLYRLISQDEDFKEAMQSTIKRILSA